MRTFHLHITGQVQGVGFRPYVYVEAERSGIKGWVKNTIDGVHIRFNAVSSEFANEFVQNIIQSAPRLSIITEHALIEVKTEAFDQFLIINSEESGKANLMVTPDFAMCEDCRMELMAASNRRYHYPFITCTNCGPRYSIVTRLPYDRPYTTMDPFEMCPRCTEEYHNPLDRRYFSQTNSCPECSVNLSIYSADTTQIKLQNVGDQIDFIVDKLNEGFVLAIKGIGGFLIICDARSNTVISKLRKRKRRPTKAFAMMFPSLEAIESQMNLKTEDINLLKGPVSPIVLLKRKSEVERLYAYDDIAPGLDTIGVMIPYAPLYALILKNYGHAIIATSGNVSNEPIIFDNNNALEKLSGIADFIITNDRDIVVPQDDSVMLHSPRFGQQVIYRRSRGIAPGFLDNWINWPEQTILAVGGELKSSFSFLYNKNCFISQYLGDLEDYGTQKAFTHTLDHFVGLFKAIPELILHDKHPGYFSTNHALELAKEFGVPFRSIQHHEAHFTAILGEKDLFSAGKPVLGIIWDGTGFGSDGHIWGGEIFRYEEGKISRIANLGYFDLILGDKMPKEPRISALSLAYGLEDGIQLLETKFSSAEWKIYKRILNEKQLISTSSMGRLFDAVASLVIDKDICSYEGEAAMYLEVCARKYFDTQDRNAFLPLVSENEQELNLDPFQLIQHVISFKMKGTDEGKIAFMFHCSLVGWVEKLVLETSVQDLAFSGGVFQNTLLIDLLIMRLGNKCKLYFHEKLSPNDECISFGQMMYHIYNVVSNE